MKKKICYIHFITNDYTFWAINKPCVQRKNTASSPHFKCTFSSWWQQNLRESSNLLPKREYTTVALLPPQVVACCTNKSRTALCYWLTLFHTGRARGMQRWGALQRTFGPRFRSNRPKPLLNFPRDVQPGARAAELHLFEIIRLHFPPIPRPAQCYHRPQLWRKTRRAMSKTRHNFAVQAGFKSQS